MNYRFSAKPYFEFGSGVRTHTAKYLKELGTSGRVMIVCGRHLQRSGMAEQFVQNIRQAGFEPVVFSECKPDCPSDVIRSGVAYAREMQVGAVVAVGGGSALDTGKAIAIMLDHDGDILDYCGARDLFHNKRTRPLIAIPSTCGTGSEVTDGGVVFDEKAGLKVSYWDWRAAPDIALIDVEMLDGLPKHLLAATAMDAMSHAVETFTSRQHNPISDAMALGAISGLARNLLPAYQDGNTQAKELVFTASTMAGMAFNRSGVHIGHAISHALGAVTHIHHGAACAMALPFVVSSQAQYMPDRMQRLADALGIPQDKQKSPGQAVAERFVQLNQLLGIYSQTHCKASDEELEKVVRLTMEDGHLDLAPAAITPEELKRYLRPLI